MSGVKVLDFANIYDTNVIENIINKNIDSLEDDDFSVDYIEYFPNTNGRLITVCIEYSDDV